MISLTSDGRIQRVNRALIGHVPRRTDGAGVPSERPVFARRHRRDSLLDESRPPHRRWPAARSSIRLNAAFCIWRSRSLPWTSTAAPDLCWWWKIPANCCARRKPAAWHEVARRVAHEIKNPLTPIALSAERIARQFRGPSRARDAHASCGNVRSSSRGKWKRSETWWTNFRNSAAFPPRTRFRPI